MSALRKLKADGTSPFVFVSARGGTVARHDRPHRREGGRSCDARVPRPSTHAAACHGSRSCHEGTDTWLIQDFLGHASIANTVRYTQLAPGRLASVRVR